MKIISKDRDYYDGAGMGIDTSIRYHRLPRELTLDFQIKTMPVYNRREDEDYYGWNPVINNGRRNHNKKKPLLTSFAVIFCGKIYHGIMATPYKSYWHDFDDSVFFYDAETLIPYLETHGYVIASEKRSFGAEPGLIVTPEEFFTPKDVVDLAINQRITVAVSNRVIDRSVYTSLNPYGNKEPDVWTLEYSRLHRIGFQKVMPPWEAHQEISMWIGGILPSSGNPMVSIIDDKIKAAKHGFDHWSFRKMPEK